MSPLPLLRRTGDDALARRAARGDEAACSVLFHRYHRRLELYCRSITRNDADAQDAAQSALAKAFAALTTQGPERALRPWLFRIAHNEAVALLRRRRPEAEVGEELAHAARGPVEVVELHEELRAVLDDVRALPPRAREALLLRELAELDYADVGGVLGISPGGARQAVFEARLALCADRAGREASCDGIRQELSDCDARRRPTRRARGHLRGCSACRSWRRAQEQRRRTFALLPALPLAGGLWAWAAGATGGGLAAGGAAPAGTTGFGVTAKVATGLAAAVAGGAPVAVEHELYRAPARAPAEHEASAPRHPAGTAARRVVAVVAPSQPATLRTALGGPTAPVRVGGATQAPATRRARDAGSGGGPDASSGEQRDAASGARHGARSGGGRDAEPSVARAPAHAETARAGTPQATAAPSRPWRTGAGAPPALVAARRPFPAGRGRTATAAADPTAAPAAESATATAPAPSPDAAPSPNAADTSATAPAPTAPPAAPAPTAPAPTAPPAAPAPAVPAPTAPAAP